MAHRSGEAALWAVAGWQDAVDCPTAGVYSAGLILSRPGCVEIQVRPSRKCWVARTGAERT
ncbi:hypothetical protein FJV76_31520 [Mesorhizobium sp. WSM4303]|nr:hypothetical protein FJV76_31520 [Mesorhizobium sp. WSM4303]TRC98953.1 hypothetical protein FJV77_06700 [Mesorhizobium sp. WSM4306]